MSSDSAVVGSAEVYLHPVEGEGAAKEQDGAGMVVTHFPFIIGRHPGSDYIIRQPAVSRAHCCLFARGGTVWVRDLGSSNGTFVNARPVRAPQQLQDGDFLKVGSQFLQVRVGAPALAAPERPRQPAAEAGSGKRPHQVLVVDDNQDTCRSLAMLLEDLGHQVHVAHSGPEAIQAAQEHPPDTVLLDLRLPGMDGYRVAEELRQGAGLNRTRIVALTGYESVRDDRRSREAGFHDVLTKPVDPETLEAVVGKS